MTCSTPLQEIHQRRNGALEPHAPPGFEQVLAANAAEFRIVPNQIGQLATLLNQIGTSESGNALLKSGYSEQFAQDHSRIFKAQRLIKVGSQQVVLGRWFAHS